MSYDMSQFHQVFFAEAAEHLERMEPLLLALDRLNPDAEQLNAVFRAAHSIKGSAGTFGFNDMAALTHVMESQLDDVRKGRRVLDDALVSVILEAIDVLNGQLATHRDGAAANPAAVAAVTQRLTALQQAAAAPVAPSGADAPRVKPAVTTDVCFEFVLDIPAAEEEGVLQALCAELADFGTVAAMTRPATASQAWQLRLNVCRDAEAAAGVIAFIANDVRCIAAVSEERDWGLFDEPSAAAAVAEDYGFLMRTLRSAAAVRCTL